MVFCKIKSLILAKHEASRRSILFFLALIPPSGTKLAAFGGNNEIENESCFVDCPIYGQHVQKVALPDSFARFEPSGGRASAGRHQNTLRDLMSRYNRI
jgi:hypothetical protein